MLPTKVHNRLGILKGARAAIAQFGHVKGIYGNERWGMCISGAMRYAYTGSTSGIVHNDQEEYWEAEAAIKADLPVYWNGYIVDWNDAPDRTKEDVLNLLDRVIIRLEQSA